MTTRGTGKTQNTSVRRIEDSSASKTCIVYRRIPPSYRSVLLVLILLIEVSFSYLFFLLVHFEYAGTSFHRIPLSFARGSQNAALIFNLHLPCSQNALCYVSLPTCTHVNSTSWGEWLALYFVLPWTAPPVWFITRSCSPCDIFLWFYFLSISPFWVVPW